MEVPYCFQTQINSHLVILNRNKLNVSNRNNHLSFFCVYCDFATTAEFIKRKSTGQYANSAERIVLRASLVGKGVGRGLHKGGKNQNLLSA